MTHKEYQKAKDDILDSLAWIDKFDRSDQSEDPEVVNQNEMVFRSIVSEQLVKERNTDSIRSLIHKVYESEVSGSKDFVQNVLIRVEDIISRRRKYGRVDNLHLIEFSGFMRLLLKKPSKGKRSLKQIFGDRLFNSLVEKYHRAKTGKDLMEYSYLSLAFERCRLLSIGNGSSYDLTFKDFHDQYSAMMGGLGDRTGILRFRNQISDSLDSKVNVIREESKEQLDRYIAEINKVITISKQL